MRRLLASLVTLLLPISATVLALPFDFSTIVTPNPQSSSVTVNGIVADGFVTNFSTPAPLWVRTDAPDDLGLGVCSEGTDNCNSGGGDVNELSDGTNPEAIRLTGPAGSFIWTHLFVSSLDSGGTNSHEEGILWWSTNPTSFTHNFAFQFGNFGGAAEGDLLTLAGLPTLTNANALYLLFTNNGANCCNNDYLVWKGDYSQTSRQAPEPGSLALLSTALAALALRRRKRS